ncbi:MAG: DUF4347 domain-containing protein [Chlorobium sp.]
MAKTMVFIDSRVNDLDLLVSQFDAGTEYGVLDATSDGLFQMQESLAGRSGYDSIQIFSHGSPGSLMLGSTSFSLANVNDYAATLSQIGSALSPAGDILLYGCNVAAGDEGRAFVESVARLTQADVAASDDVTGSAALGGDWVLEVESGRVESAPIAIAGFDGTLAIASSGSNYDLALFAQLAQISRFAYPDTVGSSLSGALSGIGWSLKGEAIGKTFGVDAVPIDSHAICAARSEGGRKEMAIAFEGTRGGIDILTDILQFGFTEYYKSIRAKVVDWLKEAVAQQYDAIYITGHSLGGAAAQIALLDIMGDQSQSIWSALFSNVDNAPLDIGDRIIDAGLTTDELNYVREHLSGATFGAPDVRLDPKKPTLSDLSSLILGGSLKAFLVDLTENLTHGLNINVYDTNWFTTHLYQFEHKVDGPYGDPVAALGNEIGQFIAIDLSTVTNLNNEDIDQRYATLNGGGATGMYLHSSAAYVESLLRALSGSKLLATTPDPDYANQLITLPQTLSATEGNDLIYLNSDTLSRQGVANALNAFGGNDILIASAETPQLATVYGSEGVDSFIVNSLGVNIIIGGLSGEHCDNLYFNMFGQISADVSGDDLVLTFKTGGETETSTVEIRNWYSGTQNYQLAEIGKIRPIPDYYWNFENYSFASLNIPLFREGTANDDNEIYGSSVEGDTMHGYAGNDNLYGRGGNDLIYGDDEAGTSSGDDYLSGGEGNDTLYGGGGNDYLYGSAGDDLLYGGDGNDTAMFDGNWNEYVIVYKSDSLSYTITDTVAGRDGVDTVSNVERLDFADMTIMEPFTNSDGSSENAAPTFTAFAAPVAKINENTTVAITLDMLKAQGNEADSDGTVDAFVVKTVTDGTLRIGTDETNATPFAWATNHTIDATHHAYWKPNTDVYGTLDAFTVVAKDDDGAKSATAVQAKVTVVSTNVAPVIAIPSESISFADKVDYTVGNGPRILTSADVDNDRDIDLIVPNWENSNTVSVLKNNGDGTFAPKVDYIAGTSPHAVTSADFNGDGYSDLAVANYYGNTCSVLINNGDGTFVEKVDYVSGDISSSIKSSDFNGDGKTDIVVTNFGDNTVSVFMNNGDGTFKAKTDYITGDAPYTVFCGDFNGDGKTDIAVTNFGDNTVSVFMNNGDGAFTAKFDYITNNQAHIITSADFNGDGKADLAVTNHDSDTISVFINQGNGTFDDQKVYAVGDQPYEITSIDINGDGIIDLAIANSNSNTISVLLNNGNGIFAPKIDYSVGSRPISITSTDLNRDGKFDFVVSNISSDTVSVLLNTSVLPATAFTEQTPVAVCSDIVINDSNGDSDWNGGKLNVQVSNHAEAVDSLTLPTTASTNIWLNPIGNKLMASFVQIGTANAASVTGQNTWHFTFNENATNALVQEVARAITFNNSSNTPSELERTVTFTVHDNEGASSSVAQIVTVTAVDEPADTIAPMLTSSFPSDDAIAVATGTNITLTFTEPVQPSTGNIVISNGSDTRTIDVTDTTQVTFDGNTVIINPTDDLQASTSYHVAIENDAMTDEAGNPFAGTSDYTFTTESAPLPRHTLSGSVTFWKDTLPLSHVELQTTSVIPTMPEVEFKNLQLHADGSRTVELWVNSPSNTVQSVQVELELQAGSSATWQNAATMPSSWTTLTNGSSNGHFVIGSVGLNALATASMQLGTITLSAPTDASRFELALLAGTINGDMLTPYSATSSNVTTGAEGDYNFNELMESTYTLQANKESASLSNAVKANDALAALKIAVGMNPNADGSAVSPYQYLAADVNHDGQVKAADALNILKMAVKFSTAPEMEWLFVSESVGSESMSRTHVVWPDNPMQATLDMDQDVHLIGIVKGDVDGSWAA